jgi:hypothetical protein
VHDDTHTSRTHTQHHVNQTWVRFYKATLGSLTGGVWDEQPEPERKTITGAKHAVIIKAFQINQFRMTEE